MDFLFLFFISLPSTYGLDYSLIHARQIATSRRLHWLSAAVRTSPKIEMRVWSAIITLALLPIVAAHFHVGAITSYNGRELIVAFPPSSGDNSCEAVLAGSSEGRGGVLLGETAQGTVCDYNVTVNFQYWFVGNVSFTTSDGRRGICYLVGQASACGDWVWRDNVWCEAPYIDC
ncbi:uncharacterized protein EI90DRAFT_3032027 [Cantharellus anzutake]|uniref:uncharacterized protein n=1 Tax=Cantharellus anzutake TaxID=1750568 RepID=UPI001904901C|nr:uncharacterized protein EI90DRAFT_3032027 [Cantharellus anzutake]KAF8342067.1 hypothetical protein EI90DRAFT_3032027 [Cantharellus anzutake]